MFPYFPTAHAPPGNKATPFRELDGGNARLFSVFQTAPFHSATRGLERELLPVLPTATALLGDRAATSSNSPGAGGTPWSWLPVPAAGALAAGTVVQAMPEAGGGEAAGGEAGGGEAVHAAVMAATATIPARRRRLLPCLICTMLLTS